MVKRLSSGATTIALFLSACSPSTVPSSVSPTHETSFRTQASNAVFCQCLHYVRNRFGFTQKQVSGSAQAIGRQLESLGYKKSDRPRLGAIAVYQSTYGNGINNTDGHAGVVRSWSYSTEVSPAKWSWVLTGANQSSTNTRIEYGCNNVNEINSSYTVGSAQASRVAFYHK